MQKYLIIFLVFLGSCAEISMPGSSLDETSSDSEIVADENISLEIPGVNSYDIVGSENNMSVAYLTDDAFLVAQLGRVSASDIEESKKEYIEMLDENTKISMFDLDISPNGRHLILGYLKLKTIIEEEIIPAPYCECSTPVSPGEPCQGFMLCHPIDPIPPRTIKKLELCYTMKDLEDIYFDEVECFEIASKSFSNSEEANEGEFLNEDAKKIIARISNSGDFNVFTSGIKQLAYFDSRIDDINIIEFDSASRQGVASMEMIRETGETIVALTGLANETSLQKQEEVILGEPGGIPLGGPLRINDLRDPTQIVPISPETSSESDSSLPLKSGARPPLLRDIIKLFVYDGDKWNDYEIADYVHLSTSIFAFQDLALSLEKPTGVLHAVVVPYGHGGGRFIEVEKQGKDLLVREHLVNILNDLDLLNVDLLIRNGAFFLGLLVQLDAAKLGTKMNSLLLQRYYELSYDGSAWLIPDELLSTKRRVLARNGENLETLLFRKRLKIGDIGLISESDKLMFSYTASSGRHVKFRAEKIKAVNDPSKFKFAGSIKYLYVGALEQDKTLILQGYKKQ